MTEPPRLLVSHKQFRAALEEAAAMDECALKAASGARQSRSYYVRHASRILPLKAVLRLAYVRAGQAWNRPQSRYAARHLGDEFAILHYTGADEGRSIASAEMTLNLLNTVAQANGQVTERTIKEKKTTLSRQEWQTLLLRLMGEQEDLCALTGLPLGYPGESDDLQMRPSLDRIDSNGHYTPDNVQIVCRFINRWKGADDDQLARRLLARLSEHHRAG